MCEFEPGECKLCWAGAFPSFMVSSAYLLRSILGLVKQSLPKSFLRVCLYLHHCSLEQVHSHRKLEDSG